jgi:hypothetical protein
MSFSNLLWGMLIAILKDVNLNTARVGIRRAVN